jgi:hypothetical protein
MHQVLHLLEVGCFAEVILGALLVRLVREELALPARLEVLLMV